MRSRTEQAGPTACREARSITRPGRPAACHTHIKACRISSLHTSLLRPDERTRDISYAYKTDAGLDDVTTCRPNGCIAEAPSPARLPAGTEG